MFAITTEPLRHWWPVTVKVPSGASPDKAGEVEEHRFKVQFEALPQEEAQALEKEASAAEFAGDTSKRNALMLRVVKDWSDVVDDKKKPLPFSEEHLRAALRTTWNRIGLSRAWIAYLSADPTLGN